LVSEEDTAANCASKSEVDAPRTRGASALVLSLGRQVLSVSTLAAVIKNDECGQAILTLGLPASTPAGTGDNRGWK
jgi:hypothetical protein